MRFVSFFIPTTVQKKAGLRTKRRMPFILGTNILGLSVALGSTVYVLINSGISFLTYDFIRYIGIVCRCDRSIAERQIRRRSISMYDQPRADLYLRTFFDPFNDRAANSLPPYNCVSHDRNAQPYQRNPPSAASGILCRFNRIADHVFHAEPFN